MADAREPGRKRRTRLTRAARRELLLDAAADIVIEEGVRGLSMEKVAERSGAAKSLTWAYFDNTAELASALYDREVQALYGAVTEAVQGAEQFEQKLRAAINAYRSTTEQRAALLSSLGPEVNNRIDGPNPNAVAFVEEWGAVIEAEFDMAAPRSWMAAMMTIAAADALVRFPFDEATWPFLEQQFVDYVLGGVENCQGPIRPRTGPEA